MKNKILKIIFIITVSILNLNASLSDGLVAHYEFEGNAKDSSGNGNDGTEYGGVSYVDGVIGKAVSFDGVDDWIDFNSKLVNTVEFTISGYIKYETIGSYSVLFSNNDMGWYGNGVYIQIYSNGYIRFEYDSGLVNDEPNFIDINNEKLHIQEKQWSHIVAVRDINGILKIYINGILVSSQQSTISNVSNINAYTGRFTTLWSEKHNYSNYSLDDLRIYNRALSEDEIKELYGVGTTPKELDSLRYSLNIEVNDFINTTNELNITLYDKEEDSYTKIYNYNSNFIYGDEYFKIEDGNISVIANELKSYEAEVKISYANLSKTIKVMGYNRGGKSLFTSLNDGLVAHYEFEGNAKDSSGNGNDGVEYGGVGYIDGVIGKAGSFDGIDDYIRIPNSEDITFLNDEDFTINVWVKPDEIQLDTKYSDNSVVEKWSGGEGYPYVIRYYNTNNHIGGAQYNYQTKFNPSIGSSLSNFASFSNVILRKKLNRLSMFIDGELISERDSKIGIIKSNSDLYISVRGHVTNVFKGEVDDLRIYNRALSENEIKSLHFLGTLGKNSSDDLTVQPQSYKDNPAQLTQSTLVLDSLDKANQTDEQTRWFKFDVNQSGVYKLIYELQQVEDNYLELGEGKVTYKLYYKDKNSSLNLIGHREFDPEDTFMLDLALNSDYEYFLEFKTNENLWGVKYSLLLLEHIDFSKSGGDNLYYQRITLDDSGEAKMRFIAPKNTTYSILMNSEHSFNANVKGTNIDYMLVDNSNDINITAPFRAGVYDVSFIGEPNSDIILKANYSDTIIEIENNDVIYSAMPYELNTSIAFDTNDSDIETLSFIATDTSPIVDINLSGSETILANIIHSSNTILSSKYKTISDNYSFDFEDEFTQKPLIKDNLYYLQLQRFPKQDGTNANYKVNIKNISQIITKDEEAYMALYEEYKVKSLKLDDNLEVIVKNEYDVTGNLIILTGDSDNTNDPLYTGSQKLSKTIYKTFSYRGFSDDEIFWINNNTNIDIDNDMRVDNVIDDTNLSVDSFLNSIENWASKDDRETPLFIYMVDHGSNGSFKIKDGEILYVNDLKNSVDKFIENTNRDVVIIIEACKSGSFEPTLMKSIYKDKIILLTSSKTGELSYIDKFGNVAFSKILSDELLSGYSIGEAFDRTKLKLSNKKGVYSKQNPIISSNDILKDITIGGQYAAASMALTSIKNIKLNGTDISSATITNKLNINSDISSGSGVKKVWATVIPPYYIPPSIDDEYVTPDLSDYTIELTYNKDDEGYEADYNISTLYNGYYDISIYVEDNDGFVISSDTTLEVKDGKELIVIDDNSNKITLNKGWNLTTLPTTGIDNHKLIWGYNNGIWEVVSNENSIQNILNKSSLNKLTTIDKNKGYWILNDNNVILDFNNQITTDLQTRINNLSNGWHILSNYVDINTNSLLNYKTIWSYQDGQWGAYSSDNIILEQIKNSKSINKIDYIDKYKGIWVNK